MVTMRSLDPGVLEIRGNTSQTIQIGAEWIGGSAIPGGRPRASARRAIQMTARLGDESDAFEEVIPVEILASPETVAAYGEASPTAKETIAMPAGVVPGFGGLHVELSSTAMVGLGEGARYLVEYPYGCAEQQASRAFALLLASDLGDAFHLPGIDPKNLQKHLAEHASGALEVPVSERRLRLLAWRVLLDVAVPDVVHPSRLQPGGVAEVRRRQGRGRARLQLLQKELAEPDPQDRGLVAGLHRLADLRGEGAGRRRTESGFEHQPPLSAARSDAGVRDVVSPRRVNRQRRDNGARVDELHRRMMNAILPEGGSAHVEELNDPYLLWFWNSNVRSTAIALRTLMRDSSADTLVRQTVRWLLNARKNGRWGNTQENAIAMEALVAYYKKYESQVPDFRAVVKLASDEIARETFQGRSTEATTRDVPMATLAAKAAPGIHARALTFSREGTGTLFYIARLNYAADRLYQEGFDSGFRIERKYAPYVENGTSPAATLSYKAGDLVRVTLSLDLTKERRFVAVTDPLPAGFEPVESWFATTAATLSADQRTNEAQGGWWNWWQRGGFDHVERHDDQVRLFATRLAEGHHEFSYVVRATTSGTFRTAPAHVEEMYEPEVFGRTETATIEVTR